MATKRSGSFVCSVQKCNPLIRHIASVLSLGLVATLFVSSTALAQTCPNGGSTLITGTVYAPNGTDPLPNILVYIPSTTLNAFTDGVSVSTPTIDDAATLVSGSPIVQTTSGINGVFTLSNAPSGSNVPLVIQAGRWRRQFVIASVTQCGTNQITTVTQGGPNSLAEYGESTSIRFAQNQGEGDIPKMALVTGKADALECTLRKMGIADSEFTDYTVDVSTDGSGPGRVSLFEGAGDSGVKAGSTTHTEDNLVGSTSSTFSGSLLGGYNILMLPCQGDSTDYTTTDGRTNAIAFTGAGGRIFATHHSAFYIDQDASIDGAAKWSTDSSVSDGTATISTNFSSGSTLAQWLQSIGSTTTVGQLTLDNDFNDQTGVKSPTQTWATMNSNSDVMQFSFYTPVGNATSSQYGRVMFNEYHVDNTTTSNSVTFPNECTTTLAKTSPMTSQEHMLEYSLFDLMNFAVPVVATNVSIAVTTSPTSFTGGDSADTINVEVTNNGTAAIATNPSVALTVTLPAGLTAVTMTDPLGNWDCNVSTLSCTLLNPLAASASNSIALTVSVAANISAGSAPIGATISSQGFSASTTGNVSLNVDAAPAGTITGPLETSATSTNVGSTTTSAATVTFDISAGTTISSISVVTEGFTGKDFSNAGSGTCTAKTYAAAATCTVIVNFSPLYPGERNGAVEIFGPSSALLDTAFITGVGIGPEAIFQPGSQGVVTSGSGSASFQDAAVDVQGNVYLVDAANNQILKEAPSGSTYTQSTLITGLNGPSGIAIDGAGNLYIANTTADNVLKETLVGGTYTQSTVVGSLSSPGGVAVDASGNVYVADTGNNRILLETRSGTSYVQSTIVSGLGSPSHIALDENADVFIADTADNRVIAETLSNGSYSESLVAGSLGAPMGVAVDDNGNVYIADSTNNTILEEQLVSGSYTQSTLVSGLSGPHAVAVDEKGNLFIADYGDKKLYREDYSDAPSLSYASTVVNTESSDSPKTETLANFGNASLTVSSVSVPTDFPQVTGNLSDCAASFSLAASSACNFRIEFDPQTTGAKSESLVVTDNNLNVTSTTQTMSLSGTSTAAVTVTLSPTSLTTPVIGVAYSQTISANGGATPYSYSLTSGSLPGGLSLNNGVISGTPTAVGTFNFTIQAQDSTGGGSGGPYTGSQSYTVTVSAPTIVVSPSSLAGGTVGTPYSQSVAASGGSGTYSYAVSAGSLPLGLTLNSSTGALTGTPTAAGPFNFTITGTDTVTTGAGAPYSGGQAYSPTVAKGTASVGVSNLTQTYTGSPLSVTATTSPTGLSVSCTYNSSPTAPTAAGTYSVQCTINDPNYTGTASGTLTINKATATVLLGSLTQTYTGSALSATATTTPSGLTVNLTYNSSSTAPTNAGSYSVVGTINDPNYQGSATGTMTINQATAPVMLGNLTQTYTGSPLSATATTTPSGLTVNLTYNSSSTAPTNAGSYTVVGTINDPNYTGTATGTLTISKATATVLLGSLTQTYTGSALSATATTTPSGLTVNLTYNSSSTAPTNAGSYSVVGTINDPNYTGTATGTMTIAKASAPVVLGNLNQTYTGSPLSAMATTTPSGLTVNLTYNSSVIAPTNAGSYTVVGTISDPNYQGTSTGTLVIAKAAATVTLGGLSQPYTGSTISASAATMPAGLAISCTYNGSSTAPTAAGTYTVVCTINDPNYQGSATGTLVIRKTQPAIVWSTPAAIAYGIPLSGAQLNATVAGIAGTFTYTPAAGTVLAAGANQALSVTFTPNDTTDYASATTTVYITVAMASPGVTLASSINPALSQNPVTFTAKVTATAGTPTGSVTFLDGTTPIGSGALSGGTATYTTSSLTVGTHSITAIYSGDANFSGSSSGATSQVVIDFALSSADGSGSGSGSGSASQTVLPGGDATYNIGITPTTGTEFPTLTVLTITGLPAGATATLNTPGWTQLTSTSWSLPAFAQLSNVSLSFQLAQPAATASRGQQPPLSPKIPVALAVLLLLPFARKIRRAGKRLGGLAILLILALSAAAVTGLSGCGASNRNGFFDVQPQNYTITVTVTTGTLSHSTNVTLEME
jgi:hypothetical protein